MSGLHSFKTLAIKLAEDGFYINNKPCRKHNIENIFDNPIYYGEFEFKGVRYKRKHEAIITQVLWVAVQEKRRLVGSPRVIIHKFPYANFIKCEKCGCYLTAEIKKGKYIYYHCTGNKGGDCKKFYIRQEQIELAIVDVLKEIYVSEEEIKEIKSLVKELLKTKEEYEDATLDSLENKLRTTKNRLSKLYIDKIDGIIDEDFYCETRHKWQIELDELKIKHEAILSCNEYFIDDVERVLELCKNAYSMYLRVSDEEKLKLIKLLSFNTWIEY